MENNDNKNTGQVSRSVFEKCVKVLVVVVVVVIGRAAVVVGRVVVDDVFDVV